MRDEECVLFLQWALPRLRLRWPGFRRVRSQVCKRLRRRLDELGLAGPDAYREYLEHRPDEWEFLDRCCRITISRFFRDRALFALLGDRVLPDLARTTNPVRVLSLGAASGEEPYSIALIWHFRLRAEFPRTELAIHAVEIDSGLIERARQGCYPPGSLRELPPAWRQAAFAPQDGEFCLHPAIRKTVRFVQHDIRASLPAGPWQVILCRNQAFTYFDQSLQEETLARILTVLADNGILVLGGHEKLPGSPPGLQPYQPPLPLFCRG